MILSNLLSPHRSSAIVICSQKVGRMPFVPRNFVSSACVTNGLWKWSYSQKRPLGCPISFVLYMPLPALVSCFVIIDIWAGADRMSVFCKRARYSKRNLAMHGVYIPANASVAAAAAEAG